MKLRNTLIVTLPDFAKHFNFPEFWENRKQFVRDMHPDKVYYWNEALKNAAAYCHRHNYRIYNDGRQADLKHVLECQAEAVKYYAYTQYALGTELYSRHPCVRQIIAKAVRIKHSENYAYNHRA